MTDLHWLTGKQQSVVPWGFWRFFSSAVCRDGHSFVWDFIFVKVLACAKTDLSFSFVMQQVEIKSFNIKSEADKLPLRLTKIARYIILSEVKISCLEFRHFIQNLNLYQTFAIYFNKQPRFLFHIIKGL